MDFFDVDAAEDGDRLVRLAHVWTDDPEAELPAGARESVTAQRTAS
jgi:hypothetical protein